MKKLVLITLFFFGMIPYLHKGQLHICGPATAYAQNEDGEEVDDGGGDGGDCYRTDNHLIVAGTEFDEYDMCTITYDCNSGAEINTSCSLQFTDHGAPPVPNPPGSGGDGSDGGDDDPPYDATSDQCDPSSSSYNPGYCEEATCNPSSVNYDPQECTNQTCDPTSVNYDPDFCTNHQTDQCDENSPDYSASACEQATCDPGSANYNEFECSSQSCDPTSINYDPGECTQEKQDQCDESSPTYDPSACEEETCNPSSVNYDPVECANQNCDASSVNYDPTECANESSDQCDESSSTYDPSACERATCDPKSVNYDPVACANQVCDTTSVNYDSETCTVKMNQALKDTTLQADTAMMHALSKYSGCDIMNTAATILYGSATHAAQYDGSVASPKGAFVMDMLWEGLFSSSINSSLPAGGTIVLSDGTPSNWTVRTGDSTHVYYMLNPDGSHMITPNGTWAVAPAATATQLMTNPDGSTYRQSTIYLSPFALNNNSNVINVIAELAHEAIHAILQQNNLNIADEDYFTYVYQAQIWAAMQSPDNNTAATAKYYSDLAAQKKIADIAAGTWNSDQAKIANITLPGVPAKVKPCPPSH